MLSERHHGTGNLRNQLVIIPENVADITTNLSTYIHRFRDRANPTVPCGSKETDVQIDTREALTFFQSGGMGRPDGRISNIAPHSAVDRPHRICVDFSIGYEFHRCRAGANVYQSET